MFKDIPMMIRLGVPDWERERAQTVTVDVSFQADATKGILTDDIEDVFDYFPLHDFVRDFGQDEREYKLLEKLTAELKKSVIKNFPKISHCTLTVTKNPFAAASVSIQI